MSNISQLFDSISGTYDRFNHLLSLNMDKRWRRKAVCGMRKAGTVLDVAAGTADLSIELARSGRASKVVGVDISTGMLEIGREKVAKAELQDKIELEEGSALDLPSPDGVYDAVTCAYGVRNFSDLDRGLSEMFRVLRPGGQLMILEFSYPENRFIRFVYNFFFSHIMPLAGRLISHDAGAYIYFRESVKGFIWGEKMVGRIASAGFSKVTFKTMTFGITTVYYAEKSS